MQRQQDEDRGTKRHKKNGVTKRTECENGYRLVLAVLQLEVETVGDDLGHVGGCRHGRDAVDHQPSLGAHVRADRHTGRRADSHRAKCLHVAPAHHLVKQKRTKSKIFKHHRSVSTSHANREGGGGGGGV